MLNIRVLPLAGEQVEAVQVVDDDTLRELKGHPWGDEQVVVMTYPTAPPVARVGLERPASLLGTVVTVGDWLVKNAAGQIEVLRPATFEERLAR